MPDLRGKTLVGRFFHAPVCGEVEALDQALLKIGSDGLIEARLLDTDAAYDEELRRAVREGCLVRSPENGVFLPGFVDLHIHAPQYPQLGTALDRPLERWLQDYTFPLEARFGDLAFARRVYAALVDDLLAHGTTTALMFASLHLPATKLLADISLEKGLRALVGKTAMDDPALCPEAYRDPSAAAALDASEALIEHIQGHPANGARLVRPVVTPRFAPSCTDALLRGLGDLARRCGCHIQTHCSESDWEEGYVQSRTGSRDAEYLDDCGLMTSRTVLAHGVLLSSSDMDLIRARQAGVAHCPLSNVYFSTAVFPLRAALEKGLRVGLGTDIAGGPSISMLDAIRMTVTASRMLDEGVDPALPPDRRGRKGARQDWRVAFHLATAGGAAALGLNVGTFEPGQAFDAQLIDLDAPGGGIRRLDEPSSSDILLEKILYTAARPNIAEVWVGGRSVAGARLQPTAG
jgi:guanine deaminase